MTPEPTLASIETEFPGWLVWRGLSGVHYGRRKATDPDRDGRLTFDARGEDAMDLRDEIVRVEGQA
jgi:hypothetical protein